MIGNLVLAGALEPEDFGRLALFQAVLGLAIGVSTFGFDSLVVRREVDVSPATIRRAIATGVATGVVAGLASYFVFGFPLIVVGLLSASCVAGASARMYAAAEQAAVRLSRSQFLTQLPYVSFAIGGMCKR